MTKAMFDFIFSQFYRGGPLFMGLITVVALLIVGAVVGAVRAGEEGRREEGRWMHAIFHLGLFALLLGVFSQAISLYQMMEAIEAVGGVSPAMLSGGLRVSFVAPLYALTVFSAAMVIRFALGQLAFRRSERDERRPAAEARS